MLQCCSSPNALPLDEKSDKYYLYIIYIIILYIVIYKYIIYYFNLTLTSLNHFGTATLQHCNKCNDVDKSERNVGTFGGQIKEWHIRGWTCRSNREFCCKEQQEGNTNRCSLLAIICKWYLLCWVVNLATDLHYIYYSKRDPVGSASLFIVFMFFFRHRLSPRRHLIADPYLISRSENTP